MLLNSISEGEEKNGQPALVLMHFLGGSVREWDEVIALLGGDWRTLRLDLPGFGGSAEVPGYSVSEMADAVLAEIAEAGLKRFVLVGHSMSGKVAMVIARRAENAGFAAKGGYGLAGLLLVAPSPPSPEPMSEEKRGGMIGLLGERHEEEADRVRARSYITKNELRDIPQVVEARATSEVLRMNRTAWCAWLTHGSKEDWAARVGILNVPALVVAGEKDLSLGPLQQEQFTLPHLRHGAIKTVPGCSHLIPMECPSVMATTIEGFVRGLVPMLATGPAVPVDYLAFIAGERVSTRTREVLETRMAGPTVVHDVLTGAQTAVLRALLTRIIPQEEPAIDLAGFIVERLATGKGDGWRFASLPRDADAYREGLDRLAAEGFLESNGVAQDAMLERTSGQAGNPAARWLEDVRAEAASTYMAHPATLARIGYSGIGVGGAGTRYKGYVALLPNEREEWEPMAVGEEALGEPVR